MTLTLGLTHPPGGQPDGDTEATKLSMCPGRLSPINLCPMTPRELQDQEKADSDSLAMPRFQPSRVCRTSLMMISPWHVSETALACTREPIHPG